MTRKHSHKKRNRQLQTDTKAKTIKTRSAPIEKAKEGNEIFIWASMLTLHKTTYGVLEKNHRDVVILDNTLAKIRNREWAALDLEVLAGTNPKIYSVRMNHSDRLLLTTEILNAKPRLLVLEVILNHKYENSRFLKSQVLKNYLHNHKDQLWEKVNAEDLERTGLEELIPENPRFKPVEYHHRFIELSELQQSVFALQTPIHVEGIPGSGKTILAETFIREKRWQNRGSQQPIIYLAQSAALVNQVRDKLSELLDHTDPELPPVWVMTYEEFAALDVPTEENAQKRTLFTEEEADNFFKSWYDTFYAEQKVLAKANQQILHPFIADPVRLYNEFKLISGYTKTQYTDKAKRISEVSAEFREAFFQHYRKFEAAIPKDKIHPHFSSLNIGIQPSFIAVDECNDLTGKQLANIFDISKGEVVFLGDGNQKLDGNKSNTRLIQAQAQKLGHHLNILKLSTTHRSAKLHSKFLNLLLQIKYELTGGIGEKNENSFIKSAEDAAEGELIWVDHLSPLLISEINELKKSHKFCIIADDIHKPMLEKHFPGTTFISPEASKGLEYTTTLLVEPFSAEVYEKISKNLPGNFEFDENQQQFNRPAPDRGNPEFNAPMHKLVVLFSRSTANIIVLRSGNKKLAKLLSPMHKLGRRLAENESLNIKDHSASTEEEWLTQAQAYHSENEYLSALSVLTKELNYSEEKAKLILLSWDRLKPGLASRSFSPSPSNTIPNQVPEGNSKEAAVIQSSLVSQELEEERINTDKVINSLLLAQEIKTLRQNYVNCLKGLAPDEKTAEQNQETMDCVWNEIFTHPQSMQLLTEEGMEFLKDVFSSSYLVSSLFNYFPRIEKDDDTSALSPTATERKDHFSDALILKIAPLMINHKDLNVVEILNILLRGKPLTLFNKLCSLYRESYLRRLNQLAPIATSNWRAGEELYSLWENIFSHPHCTQLLTHDGKKTNMDFLDTILSSKPLMHSLLYDYFPVVIKDPESYPIITPDAIEHAVELPDELVLRIAPLMLTHKNPLAIGIFLILLRCKPHLVSPVFPLLCKNEETRKQLDLLGYPDVINGRPLHVYLDMKMLFPQIPKRQPPLFPKLCEDAYGIYTLHALQGYAELEWDEGYLRSIFTGTEQGHLLAQLFHYNVGADLVLKWTARYPSLTLSMERLRKKYPCKNALQTPKSEIGYMPYVAFHGSNLFYHMISFPAGRMLFGMLSVPEFQASIIKEDLFTNSHHDVSVFHHLFMNIESQGALYCLLHNRPELISFIGNSHFHIPNPKKSMPRSFGGILMFGFCSETGNRLVNVILSHRQEVLHMLDTTLLITHLESGRRDSSRRSATQLFPPEEYFFENLIAILNLDLLKLFLQSKHTKFLTEINPKTDKPYIYRTLQICSAQQLEAILECPWIALKNISGQGSHSVLKIISERPDKAQLLPIVEKRIAVLIEKLKETLQKKTPSPVVTEGLFSEKNSTRSSGRKAKKMAVGQTERNESAVNELR
ncbi:hypothetical protein [Legionella genomosp. 1]|uniref:hypothetical protein n=1 Tax=Legionella genomosp. 1 TaxID=1093625 RepID=UPI0010565F72|nr:hypothetical protein [Legionella genomosp. 1]